MKQYPIPIEDDLNPCYCPSIPAIVYLRSLREPLAQKNNNALSKRTRKSKSTRFSRKLSRAYFELSPSPYPMPLSFAEMLNESLTEEDVIALQNASLSSRHLPDPSSSSRATSTYFAPSWEKKSGVRVQLSSVFSAKARKDTTCANGRDRASSNASSAFSGLRGPARHAQSSISVNEKSFELSAKADRLNLFPPGRKVTAKEWVSPYAQVRDCGVFTASEARRKMRKLEDELYGPPIGTESPRGLKSLISRIDALLPGIRLKEKLYGLDSLSHQRIVDVLAMDGNLNTRILHLLRMSEIESLDLTASMTDEEGLNLDARELLHVFAKPNSFLFLNEMNLSGAQLNDTDFKYIHHLPRLARLWISNTGIGNEAVFLLVSLKRSLTELDVAFNPAITDDVIPALLVLHRLRFLTLLDTGICMPGLRVYCSAVRQRKHSMELEIPRECEIYVEQMGTQYILQPEAPLISDPSLVSELSVKALKHNLAAHAEYNASISAEGSKPETAERLKTLLELRGADLAVREVLWKGEEEEEEDHEDEDDKMEADAEE